ncbi:MAG TPA: hypothetical protein VLA96_14685 [Terriglobales bacterium]|jgi:hypothetical protein|nr:hypothetical protein [Terriglobales bacterium]
MSRLTNAVILLVGCGLVGAARPQDAKPPFEFTQSRQQVVPGGTLRVVAYGDGLDIQSLEVTPAEGVTVGALKEQPPDPKSRAQSKPGVRAWAFDVAADKSAAPGERAVVAVTAQGRSYPRKVRVVTHEPVISELKVTSASANGEVGLRFAVVDSAGDISPKKPPSITAIMDCANYMLFTATEADKIVMKDKTHGTVTHLAKFGSMGREVNVKPGYCTVKISVMDAESIQSNDLEARAEFK